MYLYLEIFQQPSQIRVNAIFRYILSEKYDCYVAPLSEMHYQDTLPYPLVQVGKKLAWIMPKSPYYDIIITQHISTKIFKYLWDLKW